MHEAGYRALGLAFTYVPFEVQDLAGAIAGMRALGIRGFGVSQPYKQAVMPLLDALEPVAARIGAVNTIVNTDGRLVGHNTDWIGAVHALEEARALGGARVLLVGAGGAARAIAFGLHERGASVTIANRDASRASALAVETGARAAAFDEVERAGDYDVVVNATVVGQADTSPESPVPEASLRAGQVVMDIVYKPVHTRLYDAARARGATVLHGGRMLLHQAAAQFQLYTGRDAPLEAMSAQLAATIGG
jgi:shikimate dehydrogenase